MQHSIELAQAEIKFHKARLAVMEADQAYRAILEKEGLPYKDVEDRIRSLVKADHYLNTLPDPDPCAHCGAIAPDHPPMNDHDMELAIHK